MLRKVALGLLLVAAVVTLVLAAIQFWHYGESNYPVHASSDLEEQGRILQDRVDILTRHVDEMEWLVLILLAGSGLYSIVFVGSSYFSARSFGRQADRTIHQIKDAIVSAQAELRELREQTLGAASGETKRTIAGDSAPEIWESQIASMAHRTVGWKAKNLNDHETMELLRYESEAAYLEVAGGQRLAAAVAGLYRNFSALYAVNDSARARFYLDRARILAFAEPQLASEIRYDLACWFADAHDFEQAMRELTAAFKRQSMALDARLATDLEEGGRLYELASTPPFDRRLNDLLLKVSIP